jgi:uncharacterized protein YhfF
MEIPNKRQIQEFWTSFIKQISGERPIAESEFQAWSFGNTPEMADRLGNLVLQGVKTATASLVWSYETGDEPSPVVGGYSIILDGRGLPLGIIRTTKLYVVPFDEVDEEQAYLEGEGDRSLRYWREAHWEFFEEECRQIRRQPDIKMPVICERFVLVHREMPPDA